MNLKKKITNQKNWKSKMRLALLVPLMVVVIYIVAQSGAVDFSSITGLAILGAKGDDSLSEEVIDASKETVEDDSPDYDLLYLEGSEDEDIEENVDTPAENETDDNETVQDTPMILSGGSGGGGSGSSGHDEPPVDDDLEDDNISYTGPSMPANFWGQLYIGGNPSDANETITVKVETLNYTTDTLDNGYYTITVPGSEGDIIEFFYNNTSVGSSSWAEGKIENISLSYFN